MLRSSSHLQKGMKEKERQGLKQEGKALPEIPRRIPVTYLTASPAARELGGANTFYWVFAASEGVPPGGGEGRMDFLW